MTIGAGGMTSQRKKTQAKEMKMRHIAKLLILSASALPLLAQHPTVQLSWTPSATPGNVTTNVYRAAGECTAAGLTWTKITAAPVSGATYTDSAVTAGHHCYRVTAVLAGIESVPSGAAGVAIPPAPHTGFAAEITVAVRINERGEITARVERLQVPNVIDVRIPEAGK